MPERHWLLVHEAETGPARTTLLYALPGERHTTVHLTFPGLPFDIRERVGDCLAKDERRREGLRNGDSSH